LDVEEEEEEEGRAKSREAERYLLLLRAAGLMGWVPREAWALIVVGVN
jgi:hypothetical protein